MKPKKKGTPLSKYYNHEVRKVTTIGIKSLAVTLPATHCREMGIKKGTMVTVVKVGKEFVITKL